MNPNDYSGWLLGQSEFEAILHSAFTVPANLAFDNAVRYMLVNYPWIGSPQRTVLANAVANARRGAEAINTVPENYRLRPSEVADIRRMQIYAAQQLGLPLSPGGATWQYNANVIIEIRDADGSLIERRRHQTFFRSVRSLTRAEAEQEATLAAQAGIERMKISNPGATVASTAVVVTAVRLGF